MFSFFIFIKKHYTLSMTNEFSERLERIEKALNKAINLNITEQWKSATFNSLPAAATDNYIQALISPCKNLIDLGGKRWRPLLLILCYELAASKSKNPLLSEDQVYDLVSLVEFVHTASLICDDIEDSADYRRGKPAAHIQFGIDNAVNSAAWLFLQAPVCLERMEISAELKYKLSSLCFTEARKLHLGQTMDIMWHKEKDLFPSDDEYKAMVKCKTGTLASLAAQLGFIAGGESFEKAQEYGEIAANLGIGFQIIDDVINLTTGNPGKKRGDDIVEGKKSLPVLIHIKNHPEDKNKISEFMTQAEKEGINSPSVENCITLLNTSDCIKQAAAEGKKLITENCPKLAGSELIIKLFNSMIPEAFR